MSGKHCDEWKSVCPHVRNGSQPCCWKRHEDRLLRDMPSEEDELKVLRAENKMLREQEGVRASVMIAKLREEGGSRANEIAVEAENYRVETERLRQALLEIATTYDGKGWMRQVAEMAIAGKDWQELK